MLLFEILTFTIRQKKKKKKSKLSTPTRNDKFELTDRAYSASDIQKYFE